MFLIFVIANIHFIKTQNCNSFDEEMILGDYYYKVEGQTMVKLQYKSYEECLSNYKIDNIQLKFESGLVDNLYCLYQTQIYLNQSLQINKDYNITLGKKQLILRLPDKKGQQPFSLLNQFGNSYILNQQSIINLMMEESQVTSFKIESIKLILIHKCNINKIVKHLSDNLDFWLVMIGDVNCQMQLTHLQYDYFISQLESKEITFLKGNQFIKSKSRIEFQIHNSSFLQFKSYKDDELIFQETIMKSVLVQTSDNCIPFGQRISLGYYYTNYDQSDDIIDITYNTQSYCPQGFLHIFDENGIDQWIKIRETRILNMSKVYENSSHQFSYVTYINIVSLNSYTIQRMGQIYYYEIYGAIDIKSSKYQFKVPLKQDDQKIHKIIFFGDMDSNWTGNKSRETFDWFESIQYNQSDYDVLIFEGDMAYDLESLDCQQGDWWLRNMTTFSSYYPLLSTPGNHDSGANHEFDFYRMSFLSPEKSQYNTRKNYYNFYSVDLGLVHYIFYNPTNVVYNDSNQQEIDEMVQIMKNDLDQANQNRENVPWIIVNSHFPMYCSDSSDDQCSQNFIALRPFADLFSQYNVAIYMSAHQHNYERDAPFINNQSQVNTGLITDGPQQHLIKNSAAPIYIVEGSAGQEYYTPLVPYESQPYTIYQTGYNDGIGIMTIHNSTHIYFEQIDLVTKEVVDYFWCVQERQNYVNKALNIFLWTLLGLFILTILGIGVFYLIRRQKIKEQLLP
ncbi:unnamed protein product [Paramecium sonneborni]|uniref:Purple acid phosphatase n=1 Tax=Paramecium sonneborni TaxID=65129 RepID=A0A8S1K9X9_9CILI|nr:unnamed protein product [Paramecium sonneborni]